MKWRKKREEIILSISILYENGRHRGAGRARFPTNSVTYFDDKNNIYVQFYDGKIKLQFAWRRLRTAMRNKKMNFAVKQRRDTNCECQTEGDDDMHKPMGQIELLNIDDHINADADIILCRACVHTETWNSDIEKCRIRKWNDLINTQFNKSTVLLTGSKIGYGQHREMFFFFFVCYELWCLVWRRRG